MSGINIFRPERLEDFVGNEKVKQNLSIYLYSAKKRKVSLDHILLYGPPGCGKTSLAYIVSNELKSRIITVNAPTIEKVVDLVNLFSAINAGDILFIDEIHRLSREVEETLYSIMEDFVININYKSDEGDKILKLTIPPFTLIGATTLMGNISLPLRERFGISLKLETYSVDELSTIIEKNAAKINLNLKNEAINIIASRSRNTPRIAINFLKRLFDYGLYYKRKVITSEFAKKFFAEMQIDEYGLSNDDYEIIKILYEKYKNKPTSLESIAINMNENIVNIAEVNEPYLVSINIVERTKQGRRLTDRGLNLYHQKIRLKKLN